MKFNKIIGIGDSWTIGEGWISHEDEAVKLSKIPDWEKDGSGFAGQPKALYELRTTHSYTRWLADKFNVPYEVFAVSGGANHQFQQFFMDLNQNGKIDKNTLVIIGWSSALREQADFFPNSFDRESSFIFWSSDLVVDKDRFYRNTSSPFEAYWKKYYISNLLDTSYFEHKTLNYKLMIQEYCAHYKIPLLQCNAFESQSSKLFSKTFFKPDSTLFDEIKDEGDDIWQGEFTETMKTQGKQKKYVNALHPNIKGYKIIADKLYNYINGLYTRI